MRGYGSIETQPEFEGMESERSPLKGIKIDIPNADVETSTGSNNSKHILVSLAAFSFLIFGTFALHHNLEGASLFGRIKDEDKPRFYNNQLIDHNDVDSSTYAQKYYEKTDLFGGPGHPIFVILGGEDAVDQILYPYISQIVAEAFSGFTICIEHRFYGVSYPIKDPTNADLRRILTPAQAMADAVRLIRHKQAELGCGPRGSSTYCPVVTVGASYPGFLAAMMRFVHPDVVDIGYGSSAPLYLYSHNHDQAAYFDKITDVADAYSRGCALAVRTALTEINENLSNSEGSLEDLAENIGVCRESVPEYIDSSEVLAQEIMAVAAAHFAESNMEFYPPTEDTEFAKSCRIFQDEKASSIEKMSSFLRMREGFEKCFDLTTEVPPGPHGKISGADWSGAGGDAAGFMWDFQSCTLIQEDGRSEHSMFPPRPWSLEYLTNYCELKYGYTPVPSALVEEFGFDDLTKTSRMLLTNGLHDGWSAASVLSSIAGSVEVVNIPNGAHHSDLTHELPSDVDTWDVKDAHRRIIIILGDWLKNVKEEAVA